MMNSKMLRKRTKRVIIAAAAIAALPCFGTAMAPSASAEAHNPGAEARMKDTPDGEQRNIKNAAGTHFGFVEWNDYQNSNHSVDIDNFYLHDTSANGSSIELRVYWKGKTYKTHAYEGETKKINIGNVPNNKMVAWKACGWNNGSIVGCSSKSYFKE